MTDEQIEAVARALCDATGNYWNPDTTGPGLIALAKVAIAAYEASGWPPIETAPRDGTAILAQEARVPLPNVVWWNDWNGGLWVDAEMEDRIANIQEPLYYLNPTHWRPLPKPPEDE